MIYRYKVVTECRRSMIISESKYIKIYNKNKIVKATKGSLGIFCFKTYKDAEKFSNKSSKSIVNKILKIKPIGRGKIPKNISVFWNLKDFYNNQGFSVAHGSIPEGTVCYQSVFVLE